LITPEVLDLPFKLENWQNSVVQHRCCFTLINRAELNSHCEIFGRFSIEWDTLFLKKIGVSPVFYLPLFNFEGEDHMELVAPKFLYRMLNYHEYARECSKEANAKYNQENLKSEKNNLETYQKDKIFFNEMKGWFEGLKNMVYPIDHKRYTSENGYYMQREWKLAGNITYNGEWLTNLPTTEQQQELLSLNPIFFNKEIDYFGEKYKRAEISLFLKNIDDKHILEHATRIVVPQDYIEQVSKLIHEKGLSITIEKL
ncbi:MAG: hypothetical protein L0G42_00125, partial [Acinetobacter sp.]|nr:hypothetical protein [Acinetobacter sp.]